MNLVVRVVLALLFVWLAGCAAPAGTEHEAPTIPAALAGTRDVDLTYEVEGGKTRAAAPFGSDLRALVLSRLGAGELAAEVTEDGPRVHVVVDEAYRDRVDALLTWTGTLTVYESSKPDDLAGRIGEIGDGALVGWGDGPTLRIRATKDSPAAAMLESIRTRAGDVFIKRGSIGIGPAKSAAPDSLDIPFESSARGYAVAAKERRLLMTPRLPPLHRISEVRLPPNRTLALACLLLPIVLSFAWLVFVRRFDRAHPEPMWLVGSTFFLGALATVPAALLELGFSRLSPWLDPSLVTFGGRVSALPLAIVVFTVVVGLSEEGTKRLAAQFASRRREFDEPIDGIVYGIVASLGFAAAENIHYFAMGRLTAPLVIGRSFMSIPAHMFFGALWGYALGRKLVDPNMRAWPWLLAAAGCHGLFDALLSVDNAGAFAIGLNVLLASAFVALVRSALRHGVVTEEMLAIRPEERVFIPVGRPALFWLAAVFVHLLAFGIFVLGAYYQLARQRPTTLFVGGSSVMLALLGVAALGVTTTMELDVAIDAYGITFAGAGRPWRHIYGVAITHSHVIVDCEAGPIMIGPASSSVLARIVAEIRTRRASYS